MTADQPRRNRASGSSIPPSSTHARIPRRVCPGQGPCASLASGRRTQEDAAHGVRHVGPSATLRGRHRAQAGCGDRVAALPRSDRRPQPVPQPGRSSGDRGAARRGPRAAPGPRDDSRRSPHGRRAEGQVLRGPTPPGPSCIRRRPPLATSDLEGPRRRDVATRPELVEAGSHLPAQRPSAASTLLRDGAPGKARPPTSSSTWTALLVDLWPELVLPRDLRAAWQPVFDSFVPELGTTLPLVISAFPRARVS
jgi:hypothetical protein